MEKILGLIGAALAGLIVIAILLTNHEVGQRDAKAPALMFALDPAEVDTITIEGPDYGETELLRRGDGWVLPDRGDFPADAAKVDGMLQRLLAIREDFPTESDPDALTRFRLADDNFERRITLANAGETLATLYLGSPQGPRQSHARRAGEDTAYAVAFGLFDAPVASDDWTDKDILRLGETDITGMQVNGLHIVAAIPADSQGHWQLEGAEPSAGLDQAAAGRLAERLAELQVEQVLEREPGPDDGLEAPLLRLSVTLKDSRRVDYRIGRASLTGLFTLKVSTWPEYFRLSNYVAHQLIEAARREVLLVKTEQHAAAPAAR
ncbi:MAG: hypothetical protein Kow00114_29480 [Kiloniellaceae bacterium]